jgi:hypothetical protein
MGDEAIGAVVLTLVIVPMAGLAVAALQPSRSTVRVAAVALGLLPGLALVLLVAGWLAAR